MRLAWETFVPEAAQRFSPDVAPLAVFLASERSRFSTGSSFVVDNGWLASLV